MMKVQIYKQLQVTIIFNYATGATDCKYNETFILRTVMGNQEMFTIANFLLLRKHIQSGNL